MVNDGVGESNGEAEVDFDVFHGTFDVVGHHVSTVFVDEALHHFQPLGEEILLDLQPVAVAAFLFIARVVGDDGGVSFDLGEVAVPLVGVDAFGIVDADITIVGVQDVLRVWYRAQTLSEGVETVKVESGLVEAFQVEAYHGAGR